MKVLLINPNRFYPRGAKEVRLDLPLGLLSLAAVLEEAGVEVAILDCLISPESAVTEVEGGWRHGLADDLFIRRLAAEAPELVGLTCPFTAQLPSCLAAARLIKSVRPDLFVLAGGPHFSVEKAEFLLTHLEIDGFVRAEGEEPLRNLARHWQTPAFAETPGLVLRTLGSDGKAVIRDNPSQWLDPLDSLPLPAYHHIDMDLFFRFQEQGFHSRGGRRERTVSLITSRGCPFDCSFCSIHLHMGKRVRAHSAEYVVNHIAHLVRNYRVRHLQFEDDNLTYKPSRILRITEL
ncbi:MAG: cobalamin-dependent protein, partial [Magnetococcales bacterium]|nr:cobalamin-dependent protein [Magnetococcales bacterium]